MRCSSTRSSSSPSGRPASPGRRSSPQRRAVAFVAAALFVAHPIQTQAVTYVVQRFTSLATLFCLASLVLYAIWRLGRRAGTSGAGAPIDVAGPGRPGRHRGDAHEGDRAGAPLRHPPLRALLPRRTLAQAALVLPPLRPDAAHHPLSYLSGGGLSIAADQPPPPPARRLPDHPDRRGREVRRDALRCRPARPSITAFPTYGRSWSHGCSSRPRSCVSLAAARRGPPASRICGTGGPNVDPAFRIVSFGIAWFFLGLAPQSTFIPIPDVFVEHRLYLSSAGAAMAVATRARPGHAARVGRPPVAGHRPRRPGRVPPAGHGDDAAERGVAERAHDLARFRGEDPGTSRAHANLGTLLIRGREPGGRARRAATGRGALPGLGLAASPAGRRAPPGRPSPGEPRRSCAGRWRSTPEDPEACFNLGRPACGPAAGRSPGATSRPSSGVAPRGYEHAGGPPPASWDATGDVGRERAAPREPGALPSRAIPADVYLQAGAPPAAGEWRQVCSPRGTSRNSSMAAGSTTPPAETFLAPISGVDRGHAHLHLPLLVDEDGVLGRRRGHQGHGRRGPDRDRLRRQRAEAAGRHVRPVQVVDAAVQLLAVGDEAVPGRGGRRRGLGRVPQDAVRSHRRRGGDALVSPGRRYRRRIDGHRGRVVEVEHPPVVPGPENVVGATLAPSMETRSVSTSLAAS